MSLDGLYVYRFIMIVLIIPYRYVTGNTCAPLVVSVGTVKFSRRRVCICVMVCLRQLSPGVVVLDHITAYAENINEVSQFVNVAYSLSEGRSISETPSATAISLTVDG